MVRVLHAEHALSDRFITFMLSRDIRVEEDLLDQIFNSVETFTRLGFIEADPTGIAINSSLLSVVLHDQPRS